MGKTNNQFITSQSFLSSDIKKKAIITYGSVTRYGPQSVQVIRNKRLALLTYQQ